MECILKPAALALFEPVEYFTLLILVEHFVDIIIYIDLRTGIDDSLDLIEQFVKLHTLRIGDLVKLYLAVDGMDYRYFHLAFVGEAAHHQILRPLYLILLHMPADDVDKLLAVAACFAGAHSGYPGKLLYGDWLSSCGDL